jgi:hypothetical protein
VRAPRVQLQTRFLVASADRPDASVPSDIDDFIDQAAAADCDEQTAFVPVDLVASQDARVMEQDARMAALQRSLAQLEAKHDIQIRQLADAKVHRVAQACVIAPTEGTLGLCTPTAVLGAHPPCTRRGLF